MSQKINTIAIIAEQKAPQDARAALLPNHCKALMAQYSGLRILVQPSPHRCVPNEEYEAAGCQLTEDISDAQVLFGVKEVPAEHLIPNKTYFIFSHTIKKQPYNKGNFQAMAQKGITLIDYECLTDELGNRTVAFGYYAGIVGAYNGLRGYGLKYALYLLKPAYKCKDMAEMLEELQKVVLPPIKVVVTGRGRVARGVQYILEKAGLNQVRPAEFLRINPTKEASYFTLLTSADYHRHAQDAPFDSQEFYSKPYLYRSDFAQFARQADVLVAAAFWHPKAPKLFTLQQAQEPWFRIRLIADITCDIDGSVPTTVRPSTVLNPFYDYDMIKGKTGEPFGSIGAITTMAVDNLPCEIPKDASQHFGHELSEYVFPRLMGQDDGMLMGATILKDGNLCTDFEYLSDYLA